MRTPNYASCSLPISQRKCKISAFTCSTSQRGWILCKECSSSSCSWYACVARSLHHRYLAWTKPDTSSLLLETLTDLARGKSELVAENALLRQQVIILRRQVKRPACTKTDRMLLVLLASMVHTWKQALFIVQPETLLKWHRQGFKLFWRYKSRAASLAPRISQQTVDFIKEMARENRLWGAERIRGELLKLGIRVCKRTIQKYMRDTRSPRQRGQTWATFLQNHAKDIWACDAPAGHRPLLSFMVCLLHARSALTQSHPCGRPHLSALSYRCLDGATTAGSNSLWTIAEVSHS
jgi:hypothetical protein